MKSYRSKLRLKSPILITCEHANSRILKEYNNLGLSRGQLATSKDLYDPGSLKLAQLLSKDLQASLLYTTFSRLVVDANRRLDMIDVENNRHHVPVLKSELVVEIDGHEHLIPILGNKLNFKKEEIKRFNRFVKPYQDKGLEIISSLAERHSKVTLYSIHSFYPLYNGHHRKTDIDILSDVSKSKATRLIKVIKQHTNLLVEHNKPWSLKHADGAIFNQVQFLKNHNLIGIDVNNKHLLSIGAVSKIQKLLSKAIKSIEH